MGSVTTLYSLCRRKSSSVIRVIITFLVLAGHRAVASFGLPPRIKIGLMVSKVQRLIEWSQSYATKFRQTSEAIYIDEAIAVDREVLDLCLSSHPKRSFALSQLASHLWHRYRLFGGINDINEAIKLDQDALALRPSGHPERATSLNNLALHLSTRYKQLGGIESLNEAIALDRDALALRPSGNRLRSMSLNNLASHLYARYKQLGGIDDLNETIFHDREALALRPLGHPDRPMSLNNLALHLSSRYKQFGDIDDLNEAICLDRDALALCPPEHLDRSLFLMNLAGYLSTRSKQLGEIDDLSKAINLSRDALDLCPPGHPARSTSLHNLAALLSTRYKQLGENSDLGEAIDLSRDALGLRPPGHPGRSKPLEYLAEYLSIRFSILAEAEDKDEIFNLYAELEHVSQAVSSNDLSAAKAWTSAAEDFHHPTMLLAYETALRLLVQHLAALPTLPQNLAALKSLTSSLAADAFSACLRNQSPRNAIELLEQGRGVFWSQLTRLRSPLDEVIASGSAGKEFAGEFARLTSLIRNALQSPAADQHDRVFRLNLELQKVVSDIRALPGLSRFLLPSLFPDLRHAASGGPVIIVNASKYSCDALIVFADKDPIHIPFSVTKKDVADLSSKLRYLTKLAKTMDMTKEFGIFLRDLWDRIVFPIVDLLKTIHPLQSRIWWCPTAEFASLPLHAAGPYRKGQQNLSALYTSSYTPTLTALIRARRHDSPDPTQRKSFIAIGQAAGLNATELPAVSTELTDIGQYIKDLAMFKCIQGEESCISTVADELGQNDWVHFACHGIPNQKQPLESAFALHDGRFTIQRIIQCEPKNPEFAYLSACHTTVGDEESPDEVIYLASAMQFAGFRSVIGTMWAVDDEHTNKVTSVFYKHMVDESGRLDHTRAAFALRKTTRSVNMPMDQRILYIHLGA